MNFIFKKLKKFIFLRIFFHFVYILAIASLPTVIKYMIDDSYSNGIYDIVKLTSIFVLLIVIGMGAQYISQRSAWRLEKEFNLYFRENWFSVIICREPTDFNKNSIGDYNSRLNNDIASCAEYLEYTMMIFESLISFIIYAIYIFILNYKIAIIIYLVALIVLYLPNLTANKFSKKKKKLLDDTASYNSKIIDLLSGYAFINCFTYKNINKNYEISLSKLEESRYNFGKFKTFVNVLNGLVMYMINISSFGIMAFLLYKGEITAGVATATIAYIQNFMFPLRTVIDAISLRKSVETVMKNILLEISENKNLELENVKFTNNIKCDNVSFKYDDYIIKNFSYTFEKNKKYAIIGESGKGKSTLLNLINGNFSCTDGSITIDDREVSYRFCNQLIMYLTQKSHIFSESFWDNVTIFDSFDKTVLERDNRYIPQNKVDILLKSKNNNELSGGEKQLVNYLRAILSGKEILLLDEPFSAMDKNMEKYVCSKLLEMEDKTIIMITHNVEKDFLDKFDNIIYI